METTLNVHTEILEKIKDAAVSKGISCSRMISILMQKVMGEDIQYVRMGRLVQYQKRRRKEDWRKFHVTWREDEYEYYTDLKKILKRSVSLLLAYAVKRYLQEIINDKSTDNYRYFFRNYVAIRENIGNIICWKLIWGYSSEIEQHITH